MTELCKTRHGLEDGPEANPLAEEHLVVDDATGAAVNLVSITHHQGVNALAGKQTVSFAPGITVVYGDNAAGKSGYTRILKTARRARGAVEETSGLPSDVQSPAFEKEKIETLATQLTDALTGWVDRFRRRRG